MTDIANDKWVLVHWLNGISDESLVHPDDLAGLKATLPYNASVPSQTMARVLEADSEFCVVDLAGQRFRLKPDPTVLKSVEYHGDILPGARVVIKATGDIVTIRFLTWHHARGEPIFSVENDEGIVTKRYFQDDFQGGK